MVYLNKITTSATSSTTDHWPFGNKKKHYHDPWLLITAPLLEVFIACDIIFHFSSNCNWERVVTSHLHNYLKTDDREKTTVNNKTRVQCDEIPFTIGLLLYLITSYQSDRAQVC